MRVLTVLVIGAVLALAGCGGEGDADEPAQSRTPDTPAADQSRADGARSSGGAVEGDDAAPTAGTGTTITLGPSDFGSMLYDRRGQAIYIFERDPEGESVCYGECAEAWPPVLTEAEPRAAEGIRTSLLGTVRRRGGKLQVTYGGKPLYFYAHEDRGQVLCHNVHLNGGLWWVVGPDGRRRA